MMIDGVDSGVYGHWPVDCRCCCMDGGSCSILAIAIATNQSHRQACLS